MSVVTTNKLGRFNMIQEDIWPTIFSYMDGDTYRKVKEYNKDIRKIANADYVIAELPIPVSTAYKIHKLFISEAFIPAVYQGTPFFTDYVWDDPLTDPQILDDHLLIAPSAVSKSMTAEFANLKTKEGKKITFIYNGGSYKIEGCEASKFPEPCYIIANQTDGLRILPLSLLRDTATIDIEKLDLVSTPTPENRLTLSPRDPMSDYPNFPTNEMSPVFSVKDNILAISYANHIEIRDLENNIVILANFKNARRLSFHTTGELIATSNTECAIFTEPFSREIAPDQKLEPNEIYQGSNFKFAKICGPKVVVAYQDYHNNSWGIEIGEMLNRNTKVRTALTDEFGLRGNYVINHIENINDTMFMTASNRYNSWSTDTQENMQSSSGSINKGHWDDSINNLTKLIGNYILSSDGGKIILYNKVSSRLFKFRSNFTQRLFGDNPSVRFRSVKRLGSYLIVETKKWSINQKRDEQQLHVFDLTSDLRKTEII